MRFLRNEDYNLLIQHKNLLQINNNWEEIKVIEEASIGEMCSYLTERFDVNKIFVRIEDFDINANYNASNLINYTEKEFDNSKIYGLNERFVYKDKIYKVINDSPLMQSGFTPDFDPNNYFEFVCDNNTLYFIKPPQNEYNFKTYYKFNDYVYFEGSVYRSLTNNNKCRKPSENSNDWEFVYEFSFSGFYPDEQIILSPDLFIPTLVLDGKYFRKGDIRNKMIILNLLDIVLYHLHAKINPIDIPKLRYIRYDGDDGKGGAIGWLKKIAKGDITLDLPERNTSDNRGLSVRTGIINDRNSY